MNYICNYLIPVMTKTVESVDVGLGLGYVLKV